MDFVFNERGQVRSLFLKDTHRKDLSTALRNRFIMIGMASLVFAPFLATFFVIRHFFLNFNDYQKNPAQIGIREYNPYAEWKFREFNELYHLFKQRVSMSYPFANRYINQFPKDKTNQVAQFVALVTGAFVGVLGLATILDQDLFLNFEITEGRTTIFYLGILGAIWAFARGMLPDDNMIHDTAYSLQEVIDFTHYEPAHWKGRLHTMDVRNEFSQLYQMKLVIFVEEVLSMIFTPFVLWFSLPKCSDRIIDFFREFTIHVDGMGYVCSFAEFGFTLPGAKASTAAADQAKTDNARQEYFASKDNKLEQSYWGFINDYTRNPKTDIRYNYSNSKRKFHMPPPAPGLFSPTFPGSGQGNPFGGVGGGGDERQGVVASSPRGQIQLPASPLQSMLLDPHHLPSASGFGTSPQALRPRMGQGSMLAKTSRRVDETAQERGQSSAQRRDSTTAQRRTEPAAPGSLIDPSLGLTTTQVVEEGDLGSWKYEDETDDGDGGIDGGDEDEDVNAITGIGPLGLIRQFQKAQGEVRGAGVGTGGI
jgi:autophagy-related protein 9